MVRGKEMKRILLLVLCIALLFSVTSCNYVSSYKALMFVRYEMVDHATISFSRLEGTYVMKLRMKGEGQEGSIHCKASLKEGEINVYYDSLGVKEFLFNLKAGESIDERRGYIESGRTVYIIVETVTPAKEGKISVDLRK
jgi:thioredoxin-related protein